LEVYTREAQGIGPAIAFLYSGPAINVLAIVYSARLLGFDLGLGRAIGAIIFSIAIGFIMAFIYRKEEQNKKNDTAFANLCDNPNAKKWWQQVIFFLSWLECFCLQHLPTGLCFGSTAVLAIVTWQWFPRKNSACG
jgi:uncharacterized membrane protein YraQ (UPF0718 family)